MLRVTAIREDGSWWGVDVRTLRQAVKVARRLRWRQHWPTWINDPELPGDVRTITCWRQWHIRQRQREQEQDMENPALRETNPGLYRVH